MIGKTIKDLQKKRYFLFFPSQFPMSKVQCAICFTPQEIILESFENIEEVANILETNFHKLTETEVEIFNKQTTKCG